MGQETFTAHFELAVTIVGMILIPVVLAYVDTRRRQRDALDSTLKAQDELWREMERRQDVRHMENRERFVAIETKIDPMWKDYLSNGGKQ